MSAPAQVLVTGACGFLGRAICRELDAQGYQVHALVRPQSDRSALEGTRSRHVLGDLTDPDSLQRAAQQVADVSSSTSPPWLVHNAAALGYRRRDAQLQQAVNVEGTANVFLAAFSPLSSAANRKIAPTGSKVTPSASPPRKPVPRPWARGFATASFGATWGS